MILRRDGPRPHPAQREVLALAGGLLANHSEFVSPGLLNWTLSGELMVMVLLGGLGTLFGPVIGAAVAGDQRKHQAERERDTQTERPCAEGQQLACVHDGTSVTG